MTGIERVFEELKANWSEPKTAVHSGAALPVPLVCKLPPPARPQEIAELTRHVALPADIVETWQVCDGASLFVDETYGQWGLQLLQARSVVDETNSLIADRPHDVRNGDVVIGKFVGDSDLLIVRSDPKASDFGAVIVALPLDGRDEWSVVAPTLKNFLVTYTERQGEKFWQ